MEETKGSKKIVEKRAWIKGKEESQMKDAIMSSRKSEVENDGMFASTYSDTSSEADIDMEEEKEEENKMNKNDEVIDIGSSFFGVLMHEESHLNDDGIHIKVV